MNRLLCLLLLAFACGCSAKPPSAADVQAWQALEMPESTAEVLGPAKLDALRTEDLRRARDAVRRAVAEEPTPELLWRMARAEADLVFVLKDEGAKRIARDTAALSGLDYAQRAAAETEGDAVVLGQLAYSLGTTTHLVPMFDRDDRAIEVLKVIEQALAVDPNQITALHTQATLHLRLETLPWIAKLFSSGTPDPDLELAERSARACVSAEPSHEHRLLLAKVLVELDREDEAKDVLQAALDAGATQPRDRELEGAVRKLLKRL